MFRREDRTALPVTDTTGVLIGIVTIDDVLDVAEDAATREFQCSAGPRRSIEAVLGDLADSHGQEAGGWLVVLFLGEMLTATAMGFFEKEIARAVVLALFVPLIISSGGNSGSQASTLVIRALAVGELVQVDGCLSRHPSRGVLRLRARAAFWARSASCGSRSGRPFRICTVRTGCWSRPTVALASDWRRAVGLVGGIDAAVHSETARL